MAEPQNLGEFNGFEIYPMPMFATISVADVNGVVAWYQTALGFSTVFSAPPMPSMPSPGGQPSLVHLRRRKYQDLLVTAAPADAGSPSTGLTITFNTDGEVDQLAQRAKGAAAFGSSAVTGPIDTPWNTRDLRVTDPVGNRLVFTARNPNADPEQVARMQEMLNRWRKP